MTGLTYREANDSVPETKTKLGGLKKRVVAQTPEERLRGKRSRSPYSAVDPQRGLESKLDTETNDVAAPPREWSLIALTLVDSNALSLANS